MTETLSSNAFFVEESYPPTTSKNWALGGQLSFSPKIGLLAIQQNRTTTGRLALFDYLERDLSETIRQEMSSFQIRTTQPDDTMLLVAQNGENMDFDDSAHEDEEAWTRLNSRRVDLIRQQFSTGLNPLERDELQRLQAAMERHVNMTAPLPRRALDQLQDQVHRLRARSAREVTSE